MFSIRRCQYPGCENPLPPGEALCDAHAHLLQTPALPLETLNRLLDFQLDGGTTIREEIAYLMTLRRALDETALARLAAGEEVNLHAHATLQSSLTSKIIRALKIPTRPGADADPELSKVVVQVQDALAEEFSALKIT